MLSVVITTKNRAGMLRKALLMLNRQSLSPENFEVIVANDAEDEIDLSGLCYEAGVVLGGGHGPANARNTGVEAARGNVIVMMQDDTLPSRHVLFYHWLRHAESPKPICVQGFTDWWPDLPPLDFERFLIDSGLQANWAALKNQDGSWKRDANGFFLTTNVSIAKSEFERLDGFNTKFPDPAWEDVEFGTRGQKFGLTTIFEPNAVNYHAHRQTFQGFVKRQIMEGKSRIIFASLHPEVAPGLLDPNGLRESSTQQMQLAIKQAEEFNFSSVPDVQDIRKQRWMTALRMASLEGIRQGLAEATKRCPVWQAVPHLHLDEQCHHVVMTASRMEASDLAFAEISAEWALQGGMDNWALWAVRGEVAKAKGDKAGAYRYFTQSVALGASEIWPINALNSLE